MNSTQPRLVRVECISDLPILWAHIQRLDLLIHWQRHFPTPSTGRGR